MPVTRENLQMLDAVYRVLGRTTRAGESESAVFLKSSLRQYRGGKAASSDVVRLLPEATVEIVAEGRRIGVIYGVQEFINANFLRFEGSDPEDREAWNNHPQAVVGEDCSGLQFAVPLDDPFDGITCCLAKHDPDPERDPIPFSFFNAVASIAADPRAAMRFFMGREEVVSGRMPLLEGMDEYSRLTGRSPEQMIAEDQDGFWRWYNSKNAGTTVCVLNDTEESIKAAEELARIMSAGGSGQAGNLPAL